MREVMASGRSARQRRACLTGVWDAMSSPGNITRSGLQVGVERTWVVVVQRLRFLAQYHR
jgi:hypothetical protein